MHHLHFTEQAAFDVPLSRAIAYSNWAAMNCGFAPMRLSSPGYIAQESNLQ